MLLEINPADALFRGRLEGMLDAAVLLAVLALGFLLGIWFERRFTRKSQRAGTATPAPTVSTAARSSTHSEP